MPPTVAVIGGGIAGICAARACLENDLQVTLFEQRATLGGLWTLENSPVFDNLTTNTACFETCVSDFPPLRVDASAALSPEESLCLSRDELARYLYALVDATPNLRQRAVVSTTVTSVRAVSDGYELRYVTNGVPASAIFSKVIVATGMHHSPYMPDGDFPGMDTFPGTIQHVSEYKSPAQFQGRVLVVGGSVSGSEVVGDMATAPDGEGPSHVTLCARKMRYLATKQKGPTVVTAVISSRFEALRRLAGTMTQQMYMDEMLHIIESLTRNDQYNAPLPDGPIKLPFEPGWVPVNSKLLKASRDGSKMDWKISAVQSFCDDGTVYFQDGSSAQYDTVLFATGYRLAFPFLDDKTNQLISGEEKRPSYLDLYKLAFHPQLPNMAFVGLYPPGGAVLPPFEAQARMVARLFAHPHEMPSEEEQCAGIKAWKKQRSEPEFMAIVAGFEVLDAFAKLGGFDVDLAVYPELAKALLFAPMVPAQFRMFGHGAIPGAKEEFIRQIEASGFKVGDNSVSTAQYRELQEICIALDGSAQAPRGLKEALSFMKAS